MGHRPHHREGDRPHGVGAYRLCSICTSCVSLPVTSQLAYQLNPPLNDISAGLDDKAICDGNEKSPGACDDQAHAILHVTSSSSSHRPRPILQLFHVLELDRHPPPPPPPLSSICSTDGVIMVGRTVQLHRGQILRRRFVSSALL